MREIKFRAYNKKEKTMWGSFDLYLAVNCRKTEHVDLNDVVYMQYTWLKDKNGKEIYEGDIIKPTYWYYEDKRDYKIVSYENWYFYPLIKVEEWYNCIEKYDEKMLEVIWNIYENSELLNN
jgi:uncharacterized phage protein (TIGR01671 family)